MRSTLRCARCGSSRAKSSRRRSPHRQGLIDRWDVSPAGGDQAPHAAAGPGSRPRRSSRSPRGSRASRARRSSRRSPTATVVKTTLMRLTLHLAAAEDYPGLRRTAPALAHAHVARDRPARSTRRPRSCAAWFTDAAHQHRDPRRMTTTAPRTRGRRSCRRPHAAAARPAPARRPLADRGRDTLFVTDPRPLPDAGRRREDRPDPLPGRVRARRRSATSPPGPAPPSATSTSTRSRPSATATSTAASCSTCRAASSRPATRRSRRASSPTGTSRCSPTSDRDRIIPPEVQPLQLTLSGDQTLTVDGRVAASWTVEEGRMMITPHADFRPDGIEEEALRTARFCAPHARTFEVVMK